jgi:hypothetical protein
VRTTLTLDEDVAAKLEQEMRSSGKTLKAAVNDTLRRGFLAQPESKPQRPFRVEARDLGLRDDLNYDNVEELLDVAEGPARP